MSKWPDFLFTLSVRFVCGIVLGCLVSLLLGYRGILRALSHDHLHIVVLWLGSWGIGGGLIAAFTTPRWQTPWYKGILGAARPVGKQADSRKLNLKIAVIILTGLIALIVGNIVLFHRLQNPTPPPGAVVFDGSGIFLVPGNGWKQVRSGDFAGARNLCLPVLEGEGQSKGGVLQVFSSPSSDSQAMVTAFAATLQAQPSLIQDSFKQEEFVTETGLRVIHVCYRLSVEATGRKGETVTHSYIVRNRHGRCVRINYTTIPRLDTEAVHQMIRKTLKLL